MKPLATHTDYRKSIMYFTLTVIMPFLIACQNPVHELVVSTPTSAVITQVSSTTDVPEENWRNTLGIPVLCYHQITSEENYKKSPTPFAVTDKQFAAQMELLHSDGFYTVSSADFEAYILRKKQLPMQPGKRPVLITFDDGVNGFYTYAKPILKRYNYKGLLFIYPTYIFAKKKHSLTWPQLKEIASEGHEIGSHAMWHPLLNTMNEKEQNHQFAESKKVLEKNIPGVTVDTIAYPFGVYTDTSIKQLGLNGYRLAFTTFRGGNLQGQPPLTAKRYLIVYSDSIGAFRNYLYSKSLPLNVLSPAEGSFLTGPTEIKLKVPAGLETTLLHIRIANKAANYKYDPATGLISTLVHPTKKKLTTVQITYTENKATYRGDVLFNNHK